MKKCVTIAGLLWVASASFLLAGDSVDFPKNWKPDIDADYVDQILQASCTTESGIVPQQTWNRYVRFMARLWDSKLVVEYISLAQMLSSSEQAALKKEQTEWLQKREEESKSAGESEKGGSLEPAMRSDCFIRMTRARLGELKLSAECISLSQKLSSSEKAALKKEQAEWVRKREEESQKEGNSEKRGYLDPELYQECFIRMTQARLEELEKREAGLSKDSDPGK